MGFSMYLFAVFFAVIGIIRLMGKTTLLRESYREKIEKASEADRKSFLKWSGILSLAIGIVFAIAGFLGDHWEERWYWVVFLVPVCICLGGLGMLNRKYIKR